MDVSHDTQTPFLAVPPAILPTFLDDPDALLIDLRAPGAFARSRLPRALSLSVPSTLLKRPLFALQRLAPMLSPSARARFANYHGAPRILVYDADAGTCNLMALLTKFVNDGFKGELAWLCGGFQAVSREQSHLIETTPLQPEADDDYQDQKGSKAAPILRTHSLPLHAFSLSSTTAGRLPFPSSCPASNPFYETVRQNIELVDGVTERIPLSLPPRVRRRISDLPFAWLQALASRAQTKPRDWQYRAVETPGLRPSASPHLRSDHNLPLPSPTVVQQGADTLATQFHAIERAEQLRLMNVMQHHAKQTGFADQSHHGFPFSITAGIEKGTKNRYRHIWPFEHARVKLSRDPSGDDYINASYVQPLCTDRRYIATQGPLDATFDDFWQLCWEQNVHVILMLTKEIENSLIKCGSYWPDVGPGVSNCTRTFGPLKLTLISKIGLPGNIDLRSPDDPRHISLVTDSQLQNSTSSLQSDERNPPAKPRPRFHFQHHSQSLEQKRITTIKRTFELSHSAFPKASPRRIVHLQYLDWSDMDVPDDTRGVLGLVHLVETAVEETGGWAEPCQRQIGVLDDTSEERMSEIDPQRGVEIKALRGKRPVLLHCSAGVGRTGGFIVIDAALDAIRRELRASKRKQESPRELACIDDNCGTISPSTSESSPPPSLAQEAASPITDYKAPRALHVERLGSLPNLSELTDPIMEIVQDIREQRMSLCQTLRQYVFVHGAIIDGALQVVDEESGKPGMRGSCTSLNGNALADHSEMEDDHFSEEDEDEEWMSPDLDSHYDVDDGDSGDYFMCSGGSDMTPESSPRSLVRRVFSQPVMTAHQQQRVRDDGQHRRPCAGLEPILPMTTGKRGASPTAYIELKAKRKEIVCPGENGVIRE